MSAWNQVNYPIQAGDPLPAERRVVAVWCEQGQSESVYLPYLGYVRYGAGDPDSPYFVVYHGNPDRPIEVIAWCDCLPEMGPAWADTTDLYDSEQKRGRGFPARIQP